MLLYVGGRGLTMIDQLLTVSLHGCTKALNIGQKLAEKEPRPKIYTANPHNCTLPENFLHLLAPHENKVPSAPILAANFK